MSRQNGVPSPLASTLETTHGTSSITASSLSSASPFEGDSANINRSSSIDSSSNNSSSTGIIGRKVQIPKLSAATTELLARIAGNIRGDQQRKGSFTAGWNTSTFGNSLNDLNFSSSNTMKASSTIIELPTAPFIYTNNTLAATPASLEASTVSQESHAKPRKPVSIAPKPTATSPTGLTAPLANPQIPPTLSSQPPVPILKAPLAPLAPKAPKAPVAQSQKGPAEPRSRKTAVNRTKKGKRRRRGDDSDGEGIIRAGDSSSDESDIAPTATQTKSGRQVNRPSLYVPPASSPAAVRANGVPTNGLDTTAPRKRRRVNRKIKEVNINCIHCQRGNSPVSNAIVFCDGCNRAWHQLCHDPPINPEVVAVAEKEWHCQECKPVPISIVQPTVVRSNPDLQARLSGPSLHPPVTVPRIEAGGESFPAGERRGYLSSLSHATLVELLMNISNQNPSLPMYPSDLRGLQSSQFPFEPHIPSASASDTIPVELPIPTELTYAQGEGADSRKQASASDGNHLHSASSSRKKHQYESDEESEYEEFQEHRLYPRAGNGFRLSLNADDIDIMREDSACTTFSYALHGPAKARAEAKQSAPVWGSA
ncbi:putative PHD finger domain protein [Aspergillus clavatus NRRL 1]|uniref:PHD finger domain protein, putative n=1 Tax=Aspergillus clavatus (strain ATCC 1007 / CBS 513.65 / DSM 816 / NCTC 3887 / NRRL 1 / QM 1276 / 107) TaxID=344612 RepID=A1CR36_ASPCL|nr:PHD finger domain protein, putative [Aspergillus clavatus NRRL 1]EAW08107.1 PHD finger domain protein, putative [Aspergillus clavatus NRRL 1]